jgi:hypothetical protein
VRVAVLAHHKLHNVVETEAGLDPQIGVDVIAAGNSQLRQDRGHRFE